MPQLLLTVDEHDSAATHAVSASLGGVESRHVQP